MDEKEEKTVIIQTADGKKKVEFTEKEFNELNHLVVIKKQTGKPDKMWYIRHTDSKKLVMN